MTHIARNWVSALAIGCALFSPGVLIAGQQSGDVSNSSVVATNSSVKSPSPNEVNIPRGSSRGPEGAESTLGYVIGPGDILAVNVWKDAELSRVMPVRPDGKISLPVLGELQAAGVTALQLQDQIVEKLQDYMRNPQVNVTVQEIKSHTFNVVGKVVKSGSFELTKPTTILDALAEAGGFQDFARVSKIYVLRRGTDGSPKMLPFNYKQIIKGKQSDENVQLQSGDTVVVP